MAHRVDELDRLLVTDRLALRDWLAENHRASPGIWLVTYRKDTGMARPGFDEVVEELLCFGWIDSRLRRLDDTMTMLLCTPRSPTSQWSRVNKERVERLTRDGLMHPAGLEAVALAKRNGAWDSLNDVEGLVEPPDLAAALDASPAARLNWNGSPASYRRAVLFWLQSARRPGTRFARMRTAVAAAAENKRIDATTATARARQYGAGEERVASPRAPGALPGREARQADAPDGSRRHT